MYFVCDCCDHLKQIRQSQSQLTSVLTSGNMESGSWYPRLTLHPRIETKRKKSDSSDSGHENVIANRICLRNNYLQGARTHNGQNHGRSPSFTCDIESGINICATQSNEESER
jgi:hypothetical protein